MSAPPKFATNEPLHRRLFPNREWVLLILLLVEVAVFGAVGDNFLSRENAFEIVTHTAIAKRPSICQ